MASLSYRRSCTLLTTDFRQVLSHMQLSRPVDRVFTEEHDIPRSDVTPEGDLVSRTSAIPNLQYLANCLFAREGSAINKGDVQDLVESARALDSQLLDWADNILPTWAYSVATNIGNLPSSEFAPCQVHRYPDHYTARVWNLYRASRLIIQSIILRAMAWLAISAHTPTEIETAKAELTSINLANDICASVLFLLGGDLSRMRLYTADDGSERGRDSASARTGRFSLIWPLFLGCSSSTIPASQRTWMRQQLRQIAEDGESQAHFACLTESQTLSGGPESFRIDCV
jgi:hypothetical protein